MLRISLSFFYGLGAVLQPVSNLTAGMKLNDVWGPLYGAQNDLRSLLATEWFTPAVRNASAPGMSLLAAINAITEREDFAEGEITHGEAFAVINALKEFETILRAELTNADSYYVTRKGGYDTGILVANAEHHFQTDLGVKVPTAITDIREAGRCLAFELSTAAGFHVLRGTETVARSYWKAVTQDAAFPRLKTLGTFAAKLTELGSGDKKTVAVLGQIAALHRNPLMHPTESLDLDSAIGLFGICRSGIGAMLKEIPTPTSGILSLPSSKVTELP
jgi:hypothetical protein